MKPTDLRLNNIITDENDFEMYVVGIYEDYIIADFEGNEGDVWEFDFKHSFPKPIELTEEILLKCGFTIEKDRLYGMCYTSRNKKIKLIKHNSESFALKVYSVEIKYLHQLQNIYFALLNNELNVKL